LKNKEEEINMALTGKKLQVIDTMDLLTIDKTTGATFFSGYTTKSALDQQVDKIDINAGIGGGKICSLKTRKTITLDVTMAEFNLDLLASINGVALDKTSKGTYFLNQSVAITSNAATVTGATRIMAVRDSLTGGFLKMVSGTPASESEVKVAGTQLTFYTGYSASTALISYEGTAETGKDNFTITFDAKSFPKSAEFLLSTVAFDTDTQEIVADMYMNFYNGAIDATYNLSFEVGKNIETPIKVEILVPEKLPDGTVNTNKEVGKFVVTER
jgi:hypothetical protein